MLSDFAAEIWQELRRFMSPTERSEAADIMVQALINHDEPVENIADAFTGDSDIKQVLSQYQTDEEQFEDEDSDSNYDSDADEEW